MVLVWLAGFLLTAAPRLQLSDVESCVDRVELERELQARLPDDVGPTLLTVRRGADAESIVVELVDEGGGQRLSRSFPGRPADCPELPRAIAQVVERRLRALAQEVALHEAETVPAAPPAAPAAPQTPQLSDQAPVHSAPLGLSVRAEAGAALGVLPLGGDARINIEAAFGPHRGPFLGAFGSLRLDPPVTIGGGAALAGTGLVGGVFGYAVDVGPIIVAPVVGAGAGLTVAYGFGFERAQAPVFPMGAGMASLRVETPEGLLAGVGLEVPFVHISLSETGSARSVELPSARLFATVGVRLPPVDLTDGSKPIRE